MKDQDLFESGENVDDLFESGEDVTTLFESGEDVPTTKTVAKEEPKQTESSDISGALVAPLKGAAIGGAIGKGAQVGLDKVLDLSPETIAKIPGGRLAAEDLQFIRDNAKEYNKMNAASRSSITDAVAKATEEIKTRSFELPKEAKDIMDKKGIEVSSEKLKEILAKNLTPFGSPLKEVPVDPILSAHGISRVPIEKSGSISKDIYSSGLDPITGLPITESDPHSLNLPKAKSPSTKKVKELYATPADIARYNKELSKVSSNIPESILEVAPELRNLNLSDEGLVNFLKNVTEKDLDKIVGDKGRRVYERVQNWRKMVAMEALGGTDKENFIKGVQGDLRAEVTKQAPEADKKLTEARGKLLDYETLKREAKLAENEIIPEVKDIDEEALFKAMNDPEYAKTVVAKDATDKMLSSMGKQGLEFRRTLDNITSVLERNGYPDIARQFRMQAIKEVAKSKKIPTSAWIERALLGGAFAAIGAPAAGAAVATLSTAADLFGTKAQESLASKSFKEATKYLPIAGSVLGAGLGTIGGMAADITDEPTPEGIALESALALGLGMPASTLVAPMALKNEAIGPRKELSKEMSSLEGSKFEEEVTNPEEALESGRTLSEYQKLKLKKMQEETKKQLANPVQDFKQEEQDEATEIPQVIKPELSSKDSLFKNIVKAKERKLKDFKLKNTLTNLENDDIDSISSALSSNPNASVQEYVAQLNDIKNLQGRERTSKLFSLMQQPGFRSLLKQRKGTDNVV